jgi:amidase
MGAVAGLPVGLSLIGPAWADSRVLSFGYAFEQALALDQKPTFPASVPFPPVGLSVLAPVGR